MADSEQMKDRITRRMQELGWAIEEIEDSREEPEQVREVVSGSYQQYRLSVVFTGGEPQKVEILFEDSVVEHQHRRGTRRTWSGMESLPSPEQAIQMLWGR